MNALDNVLQYTAIIVITIATIVLLSILWHEIALWASPHRKAYKAGRKAQRDGKGLLDNPYEKGTDESAWWYSGWRDSYESRSDNR